MSGFSFLAGKVFFLISSPLFLLLGCFIVAWFLLRHRDKPTWKIGRRLLGWAGLLLLICSVLPIGYALVGQLENRFATPNSITNPAGIILLGGGEDPDVSSARGRPTIQFSLDRVLLAASLAKQYPHIPVLYSGGSNKALGTAKIKEEEAAVAAQILTQLGVSAERVFFETQSRNTYENAKLLAAAWQEKHQNFGDREWLLVTSAWHMPRAIASFRAQGWPVIAAPSNFITTGNWQDGWTWDLTINLGRLQLALREIYGLLGYWLLGRTQEIWPAP